MNYEKKYLKYKKKYLDLLKISGGSQKKTVTCLPKKTVDTQYGDPNYTGVCRQQVPYLCGKDTNAVKTNGPLCRIFRR